MAKIDVTKTELVWPGKYNENGTLKEVPRVSLPFQVIETVNESRAAREAQKTQTLSLFDTYQGQEGDTFEDGWRNKLVWGDNLLVMGSLLEKFAGKLDLVYIDPPFATGADFSFMAQVGESDESVFKEQSAVEEKAYRDTWGSGISSYLAMMMPRLCLLRELLSSEGSVFVHCDTRVNSAMRLLMDEIFGSENFHNEIRWVRSLPHNDPNQFGRSSDAILYYSKSQARTFDAQYLPQKEESVTAHYRKDATGRVYRLASLLAPGGRGPEYEYKGYVRNWRFTRVKMENLEAEGRVFVKDGQMPSRIYYLDESKGSQVQDVWADISPLNPMAGERLDYATQKPEALIERLLVSSSSQSDLVADVFCGSGTTLAVAERLGRRWIGCDLGRWAIHVTRKRMLGIESCKPFEVLNLGRYERQYWQGVTFGETKDKPLTERALYDYLAFILKLYGAQPVAGMAQLHGKKGKALVHIGAVDAPVTISEIDAAVDECAKLKQSELHVLGWEWEMGLYDLMVEAAKKKGVKLLLLIIPREVMEQEAAANGDVRFFELAYLEAEIKQPRSLAVQVALKDFVIPNTELIPEEVRSKVKKWSDFIDYWSVDWDFQNDTFMQGWVAYRTRKERKLPLTCDPHTYKKPGKYRILVKVIDIFGNDTSQAFDVEVK